MGHKAPIAGRSPLTDSSLTGVPLLLHPAISESGLLRSALRGLCPATAGDLPVPGSVVY